MFSTGQLENLLEKNFCYIKWDTISFAKSVLVRQQPISVYICYCCCANNACICCCIISYCWICWLIANLHFLLMQVFLNWALSFVFQFTSFSSNSLTCLFEIFHGNIVSIKGFLVVLNRNCLNSFVYHVLVQIAVVTEIQDILQENMVLCLLFTTLAWPFPTSVLY